MIHTHEIDHDDSAATLARSRSSVWIHRGCALAKRVSHNCTVCKMERAKLLKQRMGQLLEERVMIGSLPWTAVCLDLLGLVTVKAMVNKRSWMKVWPLLLMCQMSGAIHLEVMHDYSTVAFLLQWWRFIAVHGCPAVVV